MKSITLKILITAFLATSVQAEASEVVGTPKYSPEAAQRRAILLGSVDSFRYPGGALVNAVQEHFLDVIVTLLNRPGVREKEGPDAIRASVAMNDPEALGLLLAAGVDVNSLGGGGAEALTYAMAPGAGRAICIMADYKVDLNPGRYPNFPLLLALSNESMHSAQLLRRLGYTPGSREMELIKEKAKKRGEEAIWNGVVNTVPNEVEAVRICVDMFAIRPK